VQTIRGSEPALDELEGKWLAIARFCQKMNADGEVTKEYCQFLEP
jgi:hypothetical protein